MINSVKHSDTKFNVVNSEKVIEELLNILERIHDYSDNQNSKEVEDLLVHQMSKLIARLRYNPVDFNPWIPAVDANEEDIDFKDALVLTMKGSTRSCRHLELATYEGISVSGNFLTKLGAHIENSRVDSYMVLPEQPCNYKKLKDLHPDIERYLKEDCYLPGEIYASNRFFYEVFEPNELCTPLSSCRNFGLKFVSAICRDQILMFLLDEDDTIYEAVRYDATPHNIQEVKYLAGHADRILEEGGINRIVFDEFIKGSFEEGLNL